MSQVKALIITGYGTNSHVETAHAAKLGGADVADIVHFSDIVSTEVRLENYDFLLFPGGFLDGDDLGAAQAAAQRWLHLSDRSGRPLLDSLAAFIAAGGVILGICNGFQLLVRLGILPRLPSQTATIVPQTAPRFERQVSLSHNASARFEDRWVQLLPNPDSPCIFTHGLKGHLLPMPVRHGEGRLVAKDADTLKKIQDAGLIALSYADPKTGKATEEYPANPNGSPLGIAGLTDPTGRILGLMPHPEAFTNPTNHPCWTRGEKAILGTVLFKNAVDYLREHPVRH